MIKESGIAAMNPEKYREIDGVVFDLESFQRHCNLTKEIAEPAFAPPIHNGWYQTNNQTAPIPCMAVFNTAVSFYGSGSFYYTSHSFSGSSSGFHGYGLELI